jgi:hypothetical protein
LGIASRVAVLGIAGLSGLRLHGYVDLGDRCAGIREPGYWLPLGNGWTAAVRNLRLKLSEPSVEMEGQAAGHEG